MTKQIAVFIGSGSQKSNSQLVVNYLQTVAPKSIELVPYPIADLPLYDRDSDAQSPESYTRLRQAIAAADGVLWVTPEHNGTVSAMLKNAIDIGSRPLGQSQWIGKKLGIITVSAGMTGGVGTADLLRAVASRKFVSMPTYHVSASIANVSSAFNEQGELVNESVQRVLKEFIEGYAAFVA